MTSSKNNIQSTDIVKLLHTKLANANKQKGIQQLKAIRSLYLSINRHFDDIYIQNKIYFLREIL